jgi:hypothetical protein
VPGWRGIGGGLLCSLGWVSNTLCLNVHRGHVQDVCALFTCIHQRRARNAAEQSPQHMLTGLSHCVRVVAV